MSVREYIDWSQFNDNESSIELFRNAIRKAVNYDGFGEQKVWKAMVLSKARRIDNTEAMGLGVVAKEGVQINSPMFVFKVRLLGPNSPHLVIPDPCNLAMNADPRRVEALITLHTNILFVKTGTVDPPGEGDVVLVELMKNDMSYDVEMGTFVRSIARNVSSEPFYGTQGCTLKFDAFDDLSAFTQAPLPTGGGSTDFVTKNSEVIVTTHMANFVARIRPKLSRTAIPMITITSGYRSPEATARALYGKRAAEGFPLCGAWPGGEPPADHPCKRVWDLYRGSKLIEEILYVPNEVSAMTSVIERQVSRKQFLSNHQKGRGMDLRSRNLNSEQMKLLENVIRSEGGSFKYEPDPPHIHVKVPGSDSSTAKSQSGKPDSADTSLETASG